MTLSSFTRSLRTAAAVAALLAGVLAACGGSGGNGGDTIAPPPTLSLDSPAHLADGLTGTIALAATAAVGTAAVEFQLDGASIGPEDTAAPYQATLDTGLHAAGQHVLRARARDASGRFSDWASAIVRFGGSRDVPQGFTKDETWVTGLSAATAIAQAPDGRLFIAEQEGALRVVRNGVLRPVPFHRLAVDPSGERGLIGVTLHPDFALNGLVYVHYTSPQGGAHNRISRLIAAGDVSTGVETVLVDLPALSSATNHNGGALHFGADGKLYVGVGENANGARAADLNDPFGKLLRFNDDGSVPADNPFFATRSGLARAVWAYGLRNPFTFAFQPGSGRLHINDVGQSRWEEIDLGSAGANYGWPSSEGLDGVGTGITAPLFAYGHSSASPPGSGAGGFLTGGAIAGGAFYPDGGSFPATYHGSYFFADFSGRWVARLDTANGNAAYAFAAVADYPVDLLVASDGALLVLTRGGVTRIAVP